MAIDTTGPRMALSTAIVSQLKTITNADSENWFNDDTVYEYPNSNPSGFPFAMIVPSATESSFDTVVSNRRVYGFNIFLADQGQQQSLDTTYKNMRQLEDDVIDVIDDDYTLGGVSLGANYTLIDTQAVPSSWERTIIRGELELLIAQVELGVIVTFDLS